MLTFWLLIYAVYLVAPIHQEPTVSVDGLVFVGSLVLLFFIGSLLGSGTAIGGWRRVVSRPMSFSELGSETELFLLVGIIGAVLSLYEKIVSIELLSLFGAGALRAERAQELMEAGQHAGSVLSGIGFLCYPAGFVGMVAALASYEAQTKAVRFLAMAYVPIVFVLNIVSGGRSTILVLIVFIGLASYVRRYRAVPMIPRSVPLRYLLSALCIVFVAYAAVIWQVRSSLSEDSHEAFFEHAELVWGVTPTQTLEDIGEGLGGPSITQGIMSTIFYFTQSLSVVERILAMSEVPMMLGAYHIDIMAAAIRAFPATTDFLADGYSELLDANVYGFFASAWGALLIDFGLARRGIFRGHLGLACRDCRSAQRGLTPRVVRQ